jgi:hypothetical protein
MLDSTRGTGEYLTSEQLSYVRTPHSPNQGSEIDFRAIAKGIENNFCSVPQSFDWGMFEKDSVQSE